MRGAYWIGVGAHQAHQDCHACQDCNGQGGSVFDWGGSPPGIPGLSGLSGLLGAGAEVFIFKWKVEFHGMEWN